MKKTKKIFMLISVYNEQYNLERCLRSLNQEIRMSDVSLITFLGLNGCTDNSLLIAKACKNKYPGLNIQILESKKGKLNAQEIMVNHTSNAKSYVAFMDADVEIKKSSLRKLVDELDKHKELLAVGAFPKAKNYEGNNLWKKLLSNVLNIRARHPQSEISQCDVKDHHKLAYLDPQKINTSKTHELRSKIFFHGKLFMLRSKKYWKKPDKNEIVGDDSYLPDYLIYTYGKNRIRIRYDAIVYFQPFLTLREHFRAYKRIFLDLKLLRELYPQFAEIRRKSQMALDWSYISKQSLNDQIWFNLYDALRKIEKLIFGFSARQNPSEVWVYKNKGR